MPHIEEHHIQNFDPASFFTLHDFDGSGSWTPDEIRRTYGLEDESSNDVPLSKKESIVAEVLQVWDVDGDGRISRDEWMKGWSGQGKRLKDFGTGPGHHGDDEYEYEIHHFEKFHDESMSLSFFPLLLLFSANNKLGQLLMKMHRHERRRSQPPRRYSALQEARPRSRRRRATRATRQATHHRAKHTAEVSAALLTL